ncbi:DUF475 domain-containing protein [Synechococcus sp. Tobar12-5m-g]|uniref:DUF475 domain-containing protein n=1 Tax=unclassified Synechococcus TaxID=2626047 RepID=UPI0020CFCC32|nr:MULTISPECIES: DUF475 domain-containing protein [unclassified Synechococcus]MCP9772911.1 DUF475 domain-containing protein [Synechococcus sp. Tobar12-5m-g]MCP9873776.1 DUF475 domain-containing protein [Synechococcus sp. Cruz CV-v-12]
MGRYLPYIRWPLLCCLVGLSAILISRGWQAAWITLVLLVLEISLSFDNAVVNARVLERLTPGQQRFFLTWGLVIPVFGVRFLGPLALVALAGGVGLAEAWDAALHQPEHYKELLELAEPRILAFGGMFLLMVFLRYFFNEAKTLHWWQRIESRLSSAGRIESLEAALAVLVLLAVALVLPASQRADVLISGLIGLVLQIISTSLAQAFGGEEEAMGRIAASGGLASLVYLELLDASFSLDGTIGAFAITNQLPLILAGLGLGALFVRGLTVMLSRERALDQLIYLEHGAHYAIGALGLLMLLGVVLTRWGLHVPEWLSGLIGVVLLAFSLWDSLRHSRR